jgi:hypothetical protein
MIFASRVATYFASAWKYDLIWGSILRLRLFRNIQPTETAKMGNSAIV